MSNSVVEPAPRVTGAVKVSVPGLLPGATIPFTVVGAFTVPIPRNAPFTVRLAALIMPLLISTPLSVTAAGELMLPPGASASVAPALMVVVPL